MENLAELLKNEFSIGDSIVIRYISDKTIEFAGKIECNDESLHILQIRLLDGSIRYINYENIVDIKKINNIKSNCNDYIVMLPYTCELIKMNSLIEENNQKYCMGFTIVVKNHLKRTVSEKYHIVMNSFKIKVESDITEIDNIQKVGKDAYTLFRGNINKDLKELNDLYLKINTKDIQKELYNIIEKLQDNIKTKYGYSDYLNNPNMISQKIEPYGRVITESKTLEEVCEVLLKLGMNIPEVILKGLTYEVY